MHTRSSTARLLPLVALGGALCALLLGGCSSGDDAEFQFFQNNNTSKAVAQNALVRMKERWILFQADENTFGPAGTNYNAANGDPDTLDAIAVLVDMALKKETNLRVAVDEMAILGTGTGAWILLVVDEAKDSRDWGGNLGATDVVLLAARASSANNANLAYVATLSAGGNGRLLVSSGRAYFVEDPSVPVPLAVGETAINYVELVGANLVGPTRVLHAFNDPGTVNPLVDVVAEPDLVAVDEGLLFFTVDETQQAPAAGFLIADLNLDGDDLDTHVLGLLDTTDPAALARNVGRAVAGDSGPVRALNLAADDWLVAYLVNETDEGGINLNSGDPSALSPDLPPGWQPPQCGTTYDVDILDDVLGWLTYKDWVADPLMDPPTNTGLVGSDRVLALEVGMGNLFVATVSLEADAECNLNGDSDVAPFPDDIFRWAPVGSGTAFPVSATLLLAIEDVPGATEGAAELDNRFVIVVNEADDERNYDGNAAVDNELVGWINPNATPPTWVFDHNAGQLGVQAAGTDWMAERPQRDRLLVTFQEKILGLSINPDGDTLDSMPSFALFQPANDLDFPGPPVAIDAGNAGIVIAGDLAFYRVDEAADGRDWNGDNVQNDFILFRTTVSTLGNSNVIGVLNDLPRAALETSGSVGGAYLADEAMAGVDYNGDGDTGDFTLRWFRVP